MLIIERTHLYLIFILLFGFLYGYSVFRVVRKHLKIHSDLGEIVLEMLMYLAVYIVIFDMFFLKIEMDSIDGVNKININEDDSTCIDIVELNTNYIATVDGERFPLNTIKIYSSSEETGLPRFERVTEKYDLSYLGGSIIIKNRGYVYNLYVTEKDFNNINGETANKVIYRGN